MAMRTWNEKLYFGAMPGRNEAIGIWLAELAEHRIDRIVCLAPEEEIMRRSPVYHLWRAKQHDHEITDIPVPDYGIPEGSTADEFRQEAARVARDLGQGRRVFIHCGAGVGRTGTFAVAVLMELGYDLNAAIREIKPIGSGPETPRQREFLGAGA